MPFLLAKPAKAPLCFALESDAARTISLAAGAGAGAACGFGAGAGFGLAASVSRSSKSKSKSISLAICLDPAAKTAAFGAGAAAGSTRLTTWLEGTECFGAETTAGAEAPRVGAVGSGYPPPMAVGDGDADIALWAAGDGAETAPTDFGEGEEAGARAGGASKEKSVAWSTGSAAESIALNVAWLAPLPSTPNVSHSFLLSVSIIALYLCATLEL
mmetsp:Transcript_9364/g.22465  ORF Transcript_9364/g.22465 Transcript_9364/m.22465 type:complete len:215 (-) Transcript_9364:459-1103(-)